MPSFTRSSPPEICRVYGYPATHLRLAAADQTASAMERGFKPHRRAISAVLKREDPLRGHDSLPILTMALPVIKQYMPGSRRPDSWQSQHATTRYNRTEASLVITHTTRILQQHSRAPILAQPETRTHQPERRRRRRSGVDYVSFRARRRPAVWPLTQGTFSTRRFLDFLPPFSPWPEPRATCSLLTGVTGGSAAAVAARGSGKAKASSDSLLPLRAGSSTCSGEAVFSPSSIIQYSLRCR